MNIQYLDVIFSTAFSLRKLKTIVLKQSRDYYMRPQMHILLVSPFGTTKSSITKRLKQTYTDKDIWLIDDFTKASVEGSIGKDGDYVPPIVIHLGGKIMIIDEWNNVDQYGQQALLSVLENQSWKRSLGFKNKNPYVYTDSQGYGNISINQNIIEGKMCFGCIAFAMEYPVYDNSQKAKALLSRFSPLFFEPTKDFMELATKGEFNINVDDYGNKITDVIIPKPVYMRFHKEYYKYINKNNLYPDNTDDYGFISRIMSDIIRIGVFNYMRYKGKKIRGNVLKIDNIRCFTDAFDYITTIRNNFLNPKTKGKIQMYKDLLQKHPDENKDYYAKVLGVSRQTIWEYDRKLKISVSDFEAKDDER